MGFGVDCPAGAGAAEVAQGKETPGDAGNFCGVAPFVVAGALPFHAAGGQFDEVFAGVMEKEFFAVVGGVHIQG